MQITYRRVCCDPVKAMIRVAGCTCTSKANKGDFEPNESYRSKAQVWRNSSPDINVWNPRTALARYPCGEIERKALRFSRYNILIIPFRPASFTYLMIMMYFAITGEGGY